MAVNLFFTTMQLSITGSAGYILLKLLAAVSGRRLSQSWRYHSIVAVSLLFVLPVHRLWALIPVSHSTLLLAVSAGISSESVFLTVSPAGVGALSPQALPNAGIDWGTVIERAAALWFCVAVGLVFWNTWRLLRYHRLIRQASSKASNHLYQLALEEARLAGICGEVCLLTSPLAQSPMLVGFFHPTILLPLEQVSDSDARFILAHELTHFRRKDLWKKLLVLMVQCIHWFNPIAYLLNRDFVCWLETSCDECVVSSFDRDQRKEYGRLLINYAPTSRYMGPKLYVSFASCRYKLKRRISTMLNSNKKSRSLLGLVLAIALVAGCILTSALAAHIDNDSDSYSADGGITANDYQVDFKCDGIVGTAFSTPAARGAKSFSEILDVNNEVSKDCDYSDYTVSAAVVTAIDDNTYQIATSDGDVFAIYSTDPSKASRATWPINWIASSNEIKTDNNSFSTYDGFAINFDFRFSRQGTSYIGVALHDSRVFEVILIKDAGMAGSITFTRNMGSASFAIQNKTVYPITYTGTYSV